MGRANEGGQLLLRLWWINLKEGKFKGKGKSYSRTGHEGPEVD
jgi:hypothetical protein